MRRWREGGVAGTEGDGMNEWGGERLNAGRGVIYRKWERAVGGSNFWEEGGGGDDGARGRGRGDGMKGVEGRLACADDWRECAGSCTVTTTESGSTVGRKESECGQMGVSRMAGLEGTMSGPPAARE